MNYSLLNGACVANNIPNCALYKTDQNLLQCSSCNSGFSLSSDYMTCTQGSISNCIVYV